MAKNEDLTKIGKCYYCDIRMWIPKAVRLSNGKYSCQVCFKKLSRDRRSVVK